VERRPDSGRDATAAPADRSRAYGEGLVFAHAEVEGRQAAAGRPFERLGQGQIGPTPARNAETTTNAALAHAVTKHRNMGPSFRFELTVPGPG
jgi:hypothetical protein